MPHDLPGAALHLTCQPNRMAGFLTFAYRLENRAPVAALVMDAMPSVDRETGDVSARPEAASVLCRDDGMVLLGKFIPPLPQDRRLIAPDLPLCVLLEPGKVLERELLVPLPFAEASPHFADLPLRDYAPAEVQGVIFAIGYWPADARGLYSAAAAYAPDHLVVTPTVAPVMAGLAWQCFPTKRLEILRRSDAFPRALKNHALAAAAPPEAD